MMRTAERTRSGRANPALEPTPFHRSTKIAAILAVLGVLGLVGVIASATFTIFELIYDLDAWSWMATP